MWGNQRKKNNESKMHFITFLRKFFKQYIYFIQYLYNYFLHNQESQSVLHFLVFFLIDFFNIKTQNKH